MQTIFGGPEDKKPEPTKSAPVLMPRAGEARVPEPEGDGTFRVRRVRTRKVTRQITFFVLLGISAIFGTLVGLLLVYSTDQPQMQDLERYRPSTTTELLDVKGRPFGSFALERRIVVPYSEFPPVLREAIFSIEDKSFERNAGVNPFRVIGAALIDLRGKGRRQGASTLTMQLARNLFLSSERTWTRKVQEAALAVQMERHFTKEQIFSLYANQIYLGSGTYGFEAGSQYYFSKHARDLTLPEAALLASLPKGPESYSPVRHPDRALRRRNLVLSEMHSDKRISDAEYAAARVMPLGLHIETPPNSVAPYFVEEVRRQLENQYGSQEVHGAGLRIYTTLDLDLQLAANKSLLDGVAAYERRHGWKAHLQNVVANGDDMETYKHPDWSQPIEDGAYIHALVTEATAKRLAVRIGARTFEIAPADFAWTQMTKPDAFLKAGDVVYVRIADAKTNHVTLEQDSGAQASLMAVNNANGEVTAMVGGRDFALSQFNRATQAERQVGSSFKPYVYATAVEHGAKPTDIIVDGPTTFSTPNGPYTPHNYEADYKGAMQLVAAFAESRNIPALKLAAKVGITNVIEMAHRFGVTANIPAYLPVALGAASISLYEQVGSFSVFPNDGIRIEPHFIRRVVQSDGLPLEEKSPEVKEVISVPVARTMMVFLQAVPAYGTAASAGAVLKHPLGGKTGTTNDFTDAWFVGFSPSVTCGVWIGYDDRRTLGEKETGARAALPIWTNFMKVAIASSPADEQFPKTQKRALEVAVNSAPATVEKADKTDAEKADDDDADAAPKPAASPKPDPNAPMPAEETGPGPASNPAATGPATAPKPATHSIPQQPAVPAPRRGDPMATPSKPDPNAR